MTACAPLEMAASSSPALPQYAAPPDDGGLFPIDELVPMAALPPQPISTELVAASSQPTWPSFRVSIALAGIATAAVLYVGLSIAGGRATEQRSTAPGSRSALAESRPALALSETPRRRTHLRAPRRMQSARSPRPRSTARPRRPATSATARSMPMPAKRGVPKTGLVPARRSSPPTCEFEPSCAGPGERP